MTPDQLRNVLERSVGLCMDFQGQLVLFQKVSGRTTHAAERLQAHHGWTADQEGREKVATFESHIATWLR